MKTYIVTVPPTKDMGSYKTVARGGALESLAQNALWYYNDARAHDGLEPVRRMPVGTKYAAKVAP